MNNLVMDNPFIEEEETVKTEPKDLTKNIRGNAEKEPWTVKKDYSEEEQLARQKALLNGETLPGHKKRKNNFIYKRAQLTDIDLTIMLFLAKFDYATSKTISTLLNVKDAGRRLRGMREWKYLKNPTNTLTLQVWTLTGKAVKELERRGLTLFEPKLFSAEIPLVPFAHTLAVAHTAALTLSENNHYEKATGAGFTLENVYGERELRKALAVFGTTLDGKSTPEENLTLARKIHSMKDFNLIKCFTPLPDMSYFHRPDFIIVDEENRIVCVEVELSRKSKQETDGIIESFKKDYFGAIKKVLYVCKEPSTKDSVNRSKERVGANNRIVCAPIINRNGKIHKGPTHQL